MAVSANQLMKRQDGVKGNLPVAASTHIYQGTHVFLNAAGFADDDSATGVNGYAGEAIGESDNSAGADGDKNVEFWTEGDFEMTGSGFSQADVGSPVFADDNFGVVLVIGASSVPIGKVVGYVSSTRLIVRIRPVGTGALPVAPMTAITHTAPGTPDYAVQDLINSNAYGFVTKDEGNTVLSVLKNLQTRVADLEARG